MQLQDTYYYPYQLLTKANFVYHPDKARNSIANIVDR